MKITRLFLGVIISMLVLSVIVEGVEFLIVRMVSGQSMEYLSNNQLAYFEIRNQTWILVLKILYTFLTAFLAGWLGSRITKQLQSPLLVTMALVQGLAFLYAMFLSEFKNTLPTYYWLLLLAVVLCGIYYGHKINNKMINTE
jgi:hypothetical protein